MCELNNVLVATDMNGNKVVVIPQVIFKGKRTIPWDEVEQYLLRYVGRIFEVAETEDLIYVDRTFADEYSNSNYTKKLVGALPKVKANMSQGIPQMIEIATSKRWKEDFDHKHKKRAGKGWFRYNTRFALPVTTDTGEIVEYNVFQAVLIVRYTSDEKLYLYDIQNVKKETRYPSWTTRSDGQKPASSENNYNMSQVELQDKINENNKETSSLDECECDRSEKKILKELQEAEDAVRDGKGWLSLDELKAATND